MCCSYFLHFVGACLRLRGQAVCSRSLELITPHFAQPCNTDLWLSSYFLPLLHSHPVPSPSSCPPSLSTPSKGPSLLSCPLKVCILRHPCPQFFSPWPCPQVSATTYVLMTCRLPSSKAPLLTLDTVGTPHRHSEQNHKPRF